MQPMADHGSSWLPEERRERILRLLDEEGRLIAQAAAERLGVSLDTVRRDLDFLSEQNLVRRVRGGALRRSPALQPLQNRQQTNVDIKSGIAEKAAQLISRESFVYFDDGSTVQRVAAFLPPDLQFAAMTRQISTAQELIELSAAEVFLIGGRIDRRDGITNSPRILQDIGSSRFDLLLLGVCSLDEHEGLGARTPEEMELKRVLLRSSAKVAGLVTSDKFGTSAPFLVGEPGLLDYLVTDEPEKGRARFSRFGVTVI